MKNIIITIAIILGLGMTAFAQDNYGSEASERTGLLGWGAIFFDNEGGLFPNPNNVEYYEYEEEEYNNTPPWNYQGEGGLFGMGEGVYNRGGLRGGPLNLPNFGLNTDQEANTPLGSGIAVLIGLGAAYFVGKKRKEE